MLILNDSGSNNYARQLVLICSVYKDKEILDLAYEAGCDGFIVKPLQMELFGNVCRQLLK